MGEELNKLIYTIQEIENEKSRKIAEFDELITNRYNEIVAENGDAYIDEQYNSLNNQKQEEISKLDTKLAELYSEKVDLEKAIRAEEEKRKQWPIEREKRLALLKNEINKRMNELQNAGEDIYLDEKLQEMQLEVHKLQEEKRLEELVKAKKEYADLGIEKFVLEAEIEDMQENLDKKGTYQKLQKEKGELEEELKKLKKGTKEYEECFADIEKISEELKKHDKEIKLKKEELNKIIEKMAKLEGKYGKEELVEKRHRVKNENKEQEPIEMPSQDAVEEQVQEPIETPIQEETEEQVQEPIETPIQEETEEQVQEPIEMPSQEETEEQVQEPQGINPIYGRREEIFQEPQDYQRQDGSEEQVQEPIETPIQEETEEQVQEPIEMPSQEETEEQVQEPQGINPIYGRREEIFQEPQDYQRQDGSEEQMQEPIWIYSPSQNEDINYSNNEQEKIDPKKFIYKVSTEGIYYDSELIALNDLDNRLGMLKSAQYDEQYNEIVSELLDNDRNDEYLVSIILNDSKLDAKQKYERLIAYKESLYDTIEQDEEENDSIQIEYDLRNTSIFSRITGKCQYSSEFVTCLKEIAYKNRNNRNTTILAGPFTKLQFMIKETIENVTTKKLEASTEREEETEEKTPVTNNEQNRKSWELTPEQMKEVNSPTNGDVGEIMIDYGLKDEQTYDDDEISH